MPATHSSLEEKEDKNVIRVFGWIKGKDCMKFLDISSSQRAKIILGVMHGGIAMQVRRLQGEGAKSLPLASSINIALLMEAEEGRHFVPIPSHTVAFQPMWLVCQLGPANLVEPRDPTHSLP